MRERSIVTVPNHLLYEVTLPVTFFNNGLEDQVTLMHKFLENYEGIGLAANQIGFKNQVLIVESKSEDSNISIPFQVFINPQIVECSPDRDFFEEGCLSVPQIELPVERSNKIKLKAKNLKGKRIRLKASGLLARVLQHEIDHLNGIIFTDRIKEKLFKDFPELKKTKIVFLGSGQFAVPILKGLYLLDLKPIVITEKSKPAGRNKIIKLSQVAKLVNDFKKKLIETENINDDKIKKKIEEYQPDLIICADFGKKIPDNILNLSKKLSINIHPSLLPKYRGPSPIQTTILKGETETGVTIIKMTPEIDQGPIIAQAKTKILPSNNRPLLEEKLSMIGLKLLYNILPKLIRDKIEPIKQEKENISNTKKLTKKDGEINWQKKPEDIERQIRSFHPWPGSYTFIDKKRIIIHQAHLKDNKLVLDKVQLEGKNPIAWKEFLHGFHEQKPDWFEKIKN